MSAASPPPELAAMMAGQLFTLYVQDSPAGAPVVSGHIEPETLVWYVPSVEQGLSTGAFYYASKAQGKNGRDENKKVALKFLTDVFVGKQTPILLSPLAAAVDENNVMTFVSPACQLNLECKESAETIEAWLEGLNYILTTQGKKVVDEKTTTAELELESKRKASVADAPASPAKTGSAPSSPAAATRSASSPSSAKAAAAAAEEEEEEPSGAEALEVTQRGGAFTLYSASEPPQKISLWHEESPEDKMGILYYDRVGARNKKPSQSLRCSRLTDVLLGKQTPILSALKQLKEDEAFTMVTATMSWNLSCAEKQVNVFLIGINHVLASGGQTVVMEEEGVETTIKHAAAPASPSSAPAAAATPATVPASAAAAPAAAAAASDADAPAAVPHRRMSYKPDTTRALIPESVPDSASPNTQRASLIKAGGGAGPQGANLLAGFAPVAEESEGEEDDDEDEESEKDEDEEEDDDKDDDAPAEPNFAEEDDAPAAVTEQAPALDLEPNNVIAQMERGSTFLLHTLMAPPALTHVWLASTDGTLGSLNWCPLQNKPERAGWTQPESASNRIPVASLSDVLASDPSECKGWGFRKARLSDLSDVYLGRAQFPSAALDATKDDCCLSLMFTAGGGRKLHLESSSGAEGRNSFLFGLNHVLTSSGTAVVMEEKQTAEAAAAEAAAAAAEEQEVMAPSAPSVEPVAPLRQKRFSVIQNAASISMAKAAIEIPTEPSVPLVPAAFGLQAGLGDLMAMLRRGRTFQHHSNTTGVAESNEILLWYRTPEEETQPLHGSKKKSAGSLCWNARGIKELVGEQVLPLKKISDIFLGKQTPQFMMSHLAVSVPDAHCFTIASTKLGLSLDLQADSEAIVTSWLQAIHQILQQTGKKVVLDGEAQAPAAAAAAAAAPQAKVPGRRFSVLSATNSSTITKAIARSKPEAAKGSASRETELSAPVQDSEGLLTSGRSFTLHTVNAPAQTVLLFFVEASRTFYWNADGSKTQDASRSLELSAVSDVFLGKQTEALRGPSAANANQDCCVSVVSKRLNRSMELEAATPELLQAFLLGLSALLSGSGKSVVLEEDLPQPAAAAASAAPVRKTAARSERRFSVMSSPPSAAVGSSSKPAAAPTTTLTPGIDAYIRMLTAGREVNLFRYEGFAKTPKASRAFVWYDPNAGPLGTFFWADNAAAKSQPPNQDQAAPMNRLSDVFVGKHQPIFSTPVAANANVNHCLSLVGRGFELHMETLSPEVLAAWLAAINYILTSSGNKCVVDEGVPASASAASSPNAKGIDSRRRFSIMSKAGLSSATSSSEDAAIAHISNGSNFTRFVDGHARRLFLFFNPKVGGKLGTLFWTEPNADNQREERAECSFPIASLTDIYNGKQTKNMKTSVASMAPREQCFSLVSKSVSLDLWASSEQEVGAWIKAMRHVLSNSGAEVVDSNKNQQAPGRGGARRISVMTTSLGGTKAQVGEGALIKNMTSGSILTLHTGPAQKTLLTMFYVATFGAEGPGSNSLCWARVGAPKVPHPDARIVLKNIVDVFGKGTKSFKLISDSQAKAPNCFSLQTRNGKVFDLEAASEPERNSWLAGLKAVLASALGRKVVEAGEALGASGTAASATSATNGAYKGSKRMSFIASSASAPLKSAIGSSGLSLSGSDLYRLLLEGRPFHSFQVDSLGSTRKIKVFVFFRPDAAQAAAGSRTGSLHWVELENGLNAPVGEPKIVKGQSLNLAEISDVYLGKQTMLMESAAAADAPANCCISILSQLNCLNLQAGSPEALSAFLASFSNVLNGSGREVQLENPTPAAAAASPSAAAAAKPSKRFSIVSRSTALIPAANAKPAATLSLGLSTAITSMTAGHPFLRWHKDQSLGRIAGEPCTIFYEPAPAGATGSAQFGTLYYSPRGHRIMASKAALYLSDVRDIFLGRQSPRLLSPEASAAADNRCISLVTARSVLDLEAASAEVLSTFLQFLSGILKANGSEVVLESGTDEDPSAASAAAAASSPAAVPVSKDRRRFSVIGSAPESAAASQAPTTSFKELLVKDLQTGSDFTRFALMDPNRSVHLLYYVPEDGKFGALHLSETRIKEDNVAADVKIYLHEITDIYTGKQRPIWSEPFASLAAEDCCVSILVKSGAEFHLEADSAKRVQNMLTAINWILSAKGGRKIELEQESAASGISQTAAASSRQSRKSNDPVRRRFSIMVKAHEAQVAPASDSSAALPSSFSRGTASASLQSILTTGGFAALPSSEAQELEAALGLMARGTVMTGYAEDRRGNAVKRLILLWLNRESNTLFWSPPEGAGGVYSGKKVESVQCCLPLSDVTELLVGRSARIFQNKIALDAVHDHCFSIVGGATGVQLDLETSARTPDVLAAWISGLQACLARSGLAILVNSAEAAAAEAAVASARNLQATSARTDRRMSIMRASSSNQALMEEYDLGDVLATSTGDLLRDLGSGKISAAPALKETLRMMENGHPAVSYFADETGAIVAKEIFLFLTGAQQGGQKVTGKLCWCDRGERTQDSDSMMDLRDLKTVQLKKNTAVFQAAACAGLNKHRCFSLQAQTDDGPLELNIEMDSAEQVSAWLFGIYALVTKGGMDAVMDDPHAKAGGRGRRFSVIPTTVSGSAPSAGAHTLKAALSGNTEDALRALEVGTEFQSYETIGLNGAVASRTLLVFYAPDDTRLGSIYWCMSGTKKVKSPQRCLPLHEITDIYTGKQTRVFKSQAAAGAVSDCCWSVQGKNDFLHLEAGSKQALTTWLFGINRLITRGGKKIVLEDGAAPKQAAPNGRRFSVMAGSAGLGDAVGPSSAIARDPNAGRLLALDDCPLLHQGHVFTCYIERKGVIEKTNQFVFCETDNGSGSGARICWCQPGFRVESSLNSIRCSSLTDVYMGKQTAILKSAVAASADPKCCLSLVSRHGTFNFTLDSPALLAAWVKELTTTLQRDGRKVDEGAGAGASPSAPQGSGRRMSIMPTAIGGLPKTAQQTAIELNTKKSLLHVSTTDTVRMLQEGRRFWRYFDGLTGPQKEQVTVFYDKTSNAFYWSPVGHRAMSADACLSLAKLTDVFLGKQTDLFKHPIAANADISKCISLIDNRKQQLNIESDTSEQLSSFLFGLQSLLNKGGRAVLVDENEQRSPPSASSSSSVAAPAAAGPKKANRRFSIMSSDNIDKSKYANFKRGLLALPADVNLRTVTEGRDFFVWEVDETTGRVFKQMQHVFYVSEANSGNPPLRLGAFYWNNVGVSKECNPTRRLLLGELTDVFCGKQTAVMSDVAAAGANPKCCVTLVAAGGKQLNLEAMSPELANTFLAAINGILTGNGLQVVLEDAKGASETTKAGKKSKRFSICAAPSLPGVNMADPTAVAIANSGSRAGGTQQKQTVLGVASAEAVAALEEGRRFVRYSQAANGPVVKAVCTVFYTQASHTLWWCQPGSRTQDPKACLQVAQLADVFLGKQSPVFQSPVASAAQSNRCISLKTQAGLYLDLESESVEQLSAWLFGIQTVLSSTGRSTYVDTDKSNAPVQAPGQSRSKRFSVMGTDLSGVEQSRHATFKKAVLSIPGEENLKLMTQGHDYFVYQADPITGSVSRDRMHVFYAPQNASIFWCDVGKRKTDPKREINLHAISDLYVGKMSKALKHPVAAAADRARCLTIASTNNELNLEADSPELVTALLSGINYLLNHNGMTVQIDDNSAAAAAAGPAAGAPGTKSARRFSIVPFSKPALLPKTAQETMISVAQGSASLADVNVQQTIQMMAAGRRFTRFTMDAQGKLSQAVQSIFYSKSTNALYWCAPGERTANDANCIKLSQLRKVLLGKQTATLKHDSLKQEPNTKFVALTDSTGAELNIMAETAEVLSAWLFGLQSLVSQKSGKKVVVDTPQQHQQRMNTAPSAGGLYQKPAALPTTAHDTVVQLAARRNTLMALSDSATIDMMRNGSRFWRWSPKGAGIGKEQVLLFFSNQAFWWCAPNGPKTEEPGHCLPLKTLTGKQTFIMNAAEGAVATKCVSLIGTGGSVDLEAENNEQLSAFMFGLQGLLNQGGRGVVVDEKEEAAAVAAPAARKAPNRRFSILAPNSLETVDQSRHAGFKKAVLSLPADQNLQAMESGHTAEVFTNDAAHGGVLVRNTQHVWFQGAKQFGSICWSDSIKDRTMHADKAMNLQAITDVYVGKQYSKVWSHAVAASSDDARCLTLVSTNAQVSFEFETVQTLTVYIAGISHILNSGGMVVQLEEGQQPAAAAAAASSSSAPAPRGNGRRYSVMPFIAPSELPTNPQEVVNQLAARRPTLMALSAASTILLMEEGRMFTRYFTKPDGSVAKERVQLFVQQAGARGSVDAVYWCAPTPPGSPAVNLAQPNQRVVLSQVTDIFMGKQSKELKSPVASDAPHSNCLTIVSPLVSLSICAPNLELLSAWLFGLNRLLAQQGRDIALDEVSKPATAKTVESRRFSVVAGRAPTPSTAASLGVPLAGVEERRKSLPADANVLAMISGAQFWLYTASLDTGLVQRKLVNVWYESSGASIGTIYYCDAHMNPRVSHSSRSMPLRELSDLYNLHQSKLFASGTGVIEGSMAARCLTLVSPTHELNLEAVEEGVVDRFLEGFRFLLTNSGRRIEEEVAEVAPVSAAAMLGSPTNASYVAPETKQRRMSVMPALPSPSPSHAASSSSSSSSSSSASAASRVPAVLTLSNFDTSTLLKTGACFQRFMYDSWTKSVDVMPIWLYWRPASDNLGSGCIHWTEQDRTDFETTDDLFPDSEHTLAISDLKEIALGKASGVFERAENATVAAADSSKCFSLLGSNDGHAIEVNLESPTVELMQSWLHAIHGLLASTSGRRALVSESEGPVSLDAEEELAGDALIDELAGGADLTEEERRAILEANHGNKRRFSVQNTNNNASAALPEIVEEDD